MNQPWNPGVAPQQYQPQQGYVPPQQQPMPQQQQQPMQQQQYAPPQQQGYAPPMQQAPQNYTAPQQQMQQQYAPPQQQGYAPQQQFAPAQQMQQFAPAGSPAQGGGFGGYGRPADVFAGVENAKMGNARDKELRPKNIRRDLNMPQDANVVAWEWASFVLQFEGITLETSKNPETRGMQFIRAKYKIVWTDNPDFNVGETVVHILYTNNLYFVDEIARLVCAAVNQPPRNVPSSYYNDIVSPQQPLCNPPHFVEARVGHKLSGVSEKSRKKTPKDFFPIYYSPVQVGVDQSGALSIVRPVDQTKL